MATPRYWHTATLLENGKVLVVGGDSGNYYFISSPELYDPLTDTWSPAGFMPLPRFAHNASLLPNGKVLVTGGWAGVNNFTSAELYDPATNTWSSAAPMLTGRSNHAQILLPNGKVLVAGGSSDNGTTASAELYDPSTNAWTPAGSMAEARVEGPLNATLLGNGKVLVTAGQTNTGAALATAELYDAYTNSWSSAGSMSEARIGLTATLLPDGRVLVAGGKLSVYGSSLASAELYDPTTNTWSPAAPMAEAREGATATLLPDGMVLVAGGYDESRHSCFGTAELYDPSTNTWLSGCCMFTPRYAFRAVLLQDGHALHVGGASCEPPNWPVLASAELYIPIRSPVAVCQEGLTVAADYTCTASVWVDGGSFDPDGWRTAWGQSPFPPYNLGETAVTLTVYNEWGLSDSCTTTIRVVDNQPPAIGACPADIMVTEDPPGSGTAMVTYSEPTAMDNCPAQVTCSMPSGSSFPVGVTPVTCTANDGTNTDSCGFSVTVEVSQINHPPVADAGPDQTVQEASPVSLDGTRSYDPDNDSLSYTWGQIGGQGVSLSDPGSSTPSFTAPAVPRGGLTLTFALVVSDGDLSSAPDTVDVTVSDINHPPVADAGADQTVQEASPVNLDGTLSYDPDNEAITHSWMQTGGPAVALSDPNSRAPSFTAPLVAAAGATLTFELTVDDGMAIASDTVVVSVDNVNHPPLADAGADQTVSEGALVTLDGSLSGDPDGDSLSYSWTQSAGPAVALSDPSSATTSFTAPAVEPGGATLSFELVVHDGLASGVADSVLVTVQDINDPPACDLAAAAPSLLWPPNHKMEMIDIRGITDPNNNQVSLTVTGVTQDEPINGLGDGDSSPDAVAAGAYVVVRSERAGNRNGRVYRIAFIAQDGLGGSCSGSVTVCVPKSSNGSCIDDGQFYNSMQP